MHSKRTWFPQIEMEKTENLVDTGIPLLPQVQWGANICMFYESKADLLEATAVFLRAGLDRNELCVWAVSDPVTTLDAKSALGARIPDYERHLAAGSLNVTSGDQWHLRRDEFNLQRITGGWTAKLRQALDAGYSGLRISGNAAWRETHSRKEFGAYDQELSRTVADRKIILLCAQAQPRDKTQVDRLETNRTNHYTVARRDGLWASVGTNAPSQGDDDAAALASAVEQLSDSLKKHKIFLTHREKSVLALIVRGVSSKKGGQMLGISPRTIEFHRSNIMQKLDVHNVAELVHTVMRNNTMSGAI